MFRSRVIPEFAPDGTVEFVLTVWRDVTEQHLAELERADLYRDLRAGEQQVQELVAGFVNEHGRELQRVVDVAQLERLTVQDRNVLQLVAKGWTNREIGARLGRTPGTVKKLRRCHPLQVECERSHTGRGASCRARSGGPNTLGRSERRGDHALTSHVARQAARHAASQ